MDAQRLNQLKIDRISKGRLSHLIRYAQLTDDEKMELVGIIEFITTGKETKESTHEFGISQRK